MHEVPRRGVGRPTVSFKVNTAAMVEALDKAIDDSQQWSYNVDKPRCA